MHYLSKLYRSFFEGNKIADDLVKIGPTSLFYGLQPFFGVLATIAKSAMFQ